MKNVFFSWSTVKNIALQGRLEVVYRFYFSPVSFNSLQKGHSNSVSYKEVQAFDKNTHCKCPHIVSSPVIHQSIPSVVWLRNRPAKIGDIGNANLSFNQNCKCHLMTCPSSLTIHRDLPTGCIRSSLKCSCYRHSRRSVIRAVNMYGNWAKCKAPHQN